MKRYIRTKDGKIIDLQAVNHSIRHSKIRKINNGDIKVEKESDTIEELIEVGDLITTKILPNDIDTFVITKLDIPEIYPEYITELYTKQGNNYILVARKENGEWRVI